MSLLHIRAIMWSALISIQDAKWPAARRELLAWGWRTAYRRHCIGKHTLARSLGRCRRDRRSWCFQHVFSMGGTLSSHLDVSTYRLAMQ